MKLTNENLMSVHTVGLRVNAAFVGDHSART